MPARVDARVDLTRHATDQELEPGDTVFALDEDTKQIVASAVVGQAESGDKEIFEIRAGNRVIGASGNHPFLVLRDDRATWTPVDSLRVGDQVAVATPVRELVGARSGPMAVDVPELASDVVTSIESVGVETTYDIEVAGHHNFVAEGFVVHNSEVVYHKNREDLEAQGVIFTDMDTALREHPEIVKAYFGKIIPKNDNKFAALNSAVWSGGCLTASARINVHGKGLMSIADIEAGDEVFGTDLGRHLVRGKVLAKVDSGVKPVYRIRVAGRVLEATGNHKFLVARRDDRGRWQPVWAPLDEIEIGEPIAISRELPDDGEPVALPLPKAYSRNGHLQGLVFPTDTSGDLMWLLGLWLGDGHTASPHEHMRQISFSVPTSDPVHDEAIDALWRVFGVRHVTPVSCGFVVSSKELGVWLSDIGFEGHAKTKRLPAWVYSIPQYQQLALIAGLIDSDGWSEREGASMCVELSNHDLLEDIRQLAIACGLFADGRLTKRTKTVEFKDGRVVSSTSCGCGSRAILLSFRLATRTRPEGGHQSRRARYSTSSVSTSALSALTQSALQFFARRS